MIAEETRSVPNSVPRQRQARGMGSVTTENHESTSTKRPGRLEYAISLRGAGPARTIGFGTVGVSHHHLAGARDGFRVSVSVPSSKMLNRLRRKPGVSAESGLTKTSGSWVGPFME